MNKNIIAVMSAAVLMAAIGGATAQETKGGFCKVDGVRLSNTGDALVEKKLWEYKEARLPKEPVIGWVDVACADRGEPRSMLQDLGKRVWFNVAGPEGGTLDRGQLIVGNSVLTGLQGDAGLSIRGLSIYGVISPRHDCTFEVSVWAPSCPASH